MPQSTRGDLEKGGNADGDQTRSAPNQPPQGESSFGDSSGPFFAVYSKVVTEEDKKMKQSAPNGPPQGEFSFGDSSGPLFSIYSKATEEEDRKMVKRWQKYADGVFIFTGLFSAAVAALLTVTVPDLKPNSQDTSAFYLGNIYEVLADGNATRDNPKPPPFSPPRHAIWVNSLWFSSLVVSLCCALLATSLHQWARRYVRLTRHEGRTLEKRARMRAFFSSGVNKLRIPWAVEGLPTLLHLALLLFFAGLAIFLFNVDKEVFKSVAALIGLFSMVYGLITVLPLIRHDSPYYTPLSVPAWLLYAGIPYVTFKVLAVINYSYGSYETWERCDRLKDRYCGWVLGGMEKMAEEMALEQSSAIDVDILGWTVGALGDDDALEEVFMAIPGFFSSKLVTNLEKDFPETVLETFWSVLDGFMGRTLSSNLVADEVKSRRLKICKDIMGMIPCLNDNRLNNIRSHSSFDQAPVSVERLMAMARWFSHTKEVVAETARIKAAQNLSRIQDRDGRWIALASDVYGLSRPHLEHHVALGGDNVLLATLIDVSRQAIHSNTLGGVVESLTRFDICHTLPELQRDFCAMWNEFVREARKEGYPNVPVVILCWIRHLYIALHRGTDSAPTAFSDSTLDEDPILDKPSSYPFCNDITSHCHPKSPPLPTHSSNPTTLGEIRNCSQAHTGPPPTDVSPLDLVATMLPCTLEGTTDTAFTSNPLLPVWSIISSSISTSPPSHVPPLPNGELLALLSGATPSHPISTAALPCLRARGLVNTGGMHSANAVLQLLARSPPFWNMFRELGDLRGQCGAAGLETRGNATPLVDATVRFIDEFMFKENEPPMQQPSQQAARGKPRENQAERELNSVDSFEPIYLYDAMKEKRQLKTLLSGKHQDAEEFFALYLDALDEELVELHTYTSAHKLASTSSVEGLKEETQSTKGQTEGGKQDYSANSINSPISRMFGGKSRLTVRVPSQPDTVTIEAWRSLKLNIQPNSVQTIEDAVAQITQLQPVQVGQSSSSEASQQVLLEALPPVLVLHLKRFLYDASANCINKTSKSVQFAPGLIIPLEFMAPVAGKSAEPAHYKLCGVLYHHGDSAGSGHYTVDVLHPNGDSGSEEAWLHIDDEAVKAVQHDVVFRGHDNERVDDQCVYMLFYCRIVPTQT